MSGYAVTTANSFLPTDHVGLFLPRSANLVDQSSHLVFRIYVNMKRSAC